MIICLPFRSVTVILKFPEFLTSAADDITQCSIFIRQCLVARTTDNHVVLFIELLRRPEIELHVRLCKHVIRKSHVSRADNHSLHCERKKAILREKLAFKTNIYIEIKCLGLVITLN